MDRPPSRWLLLLALGTPALAQGEAASPENPWLWAVLVLLFALSAFFSASETAITTLYPWKLRELAESKNGPFRLLSKDITRFLTTILVGNNLVNIAATATSAGRIGGRVSGSEVNRRRERNRRLRTKLQRKGTKSATRLLRKRSRKEHRFASNINHQISKKIVAEAQRTGHGIALEDLTGIRERVRSRKPQRARQSSWAFAELGAHITYKAERAGVPVIFVDPAYTSQDCHACGHRDKRNRPNQETFSCQSCGVSLHADENAALNIATRGAQGWGAVNLPHAA